MPRQERIIGRTTKPAGSVGHTRPGSKWAPDPGSGADIADALRRIAELPREALIDVWVKAYGRSPPKGISRRLLQYSAAYYLQTQALGGLGRATRRKLDQALLPPTEVEPAPTRPNRGAPLPAGSRLVREWNGRVHTVDVIYSNFLYNGRSYRSLSEIARVITGTRWSGPRFFGL
jgi:Protein of unknown function (DUF2924)